VLATGGQAPDVVLEDRPAKDAQRLAEVKKELNAVRQQYVDAKTTSDRTALQRRMMELMKEQRELEGGGGAADPSDDDVPDK
jgi:hypothetical protein